MSIGKRAATAVAFVGGCALSTACLSTSINSRPRVHSDGMGADLRILMDDSCLPPPESEEDGPRGPGDRSLGFGGELAFEAGMLLFDSVGAWMQQMGAPKIDRSTGVASGKLFSSPDQLDFNRNTACVHIIRSGFDPSGPSFGNAPEEFLSDWRRLGLTSRPSYYAQVELVPDEEGSGFFTGELRKLVVLDFERDARYDTRDYLMVMDFERPEPRTYVQFTPEGAVEFQEASGFARGVFKLPGVRHGEFISGNAANGLETGWMPLDFSGLERDSGIFNLFVDVLELKRGDPLLADIGSLLRSDSVQRAAAEELRKEIDSEGTRLDREEERTDELSDQRQLTRSLDAAVLDLRRTMASEFAEADDLTGAIEPVEDALFDIERRQNWRGPRPDAKIDAANALLDEAFAQREALLAEELGEQ
ncbi:MAG: hypothetical protein KDA53_10795 [Hyphomonas sp.]|nr:hypothetical protein [Hyphomonas sp.]